MDRHRASEAIEMAISRGIPVRVIADEFSLAKSSVQRHKDRMITRMASAQSAQFTGPEDLLARVRGLQMDAEEILVKSKRTGDHRMALLAIKEARSCLELLAKMLGELQSGTTVNITVSQQWITLRATLIAALGAFPEARLAVMRALETHEPGN